MVEKNNSQIPWVPAENLVREGQAPEKQPHNDKKAPHMEKIVAKGPQLI